MSGAAARPGEGDSCPGGVPRGASAARPAPPRPAPPRVTSRAEAAGGWGRRPGLGEERPAVRAGVPAADPGPGARAGAAGTGRAAVGEEPTWFPSLDSARSGQAAETAPGRVGGAAALGVWTSPHPGVQGPERSELRRECAPLPALHTSAVWNQARPRDTERRPSRTCQRRCSSGLMDGSSCLCERMRQSATVQY
ncbi:uncharacterized protein LOC110350320 [Heterocephalus glaber]|uniref:Uncharacterized protein LOC110350320 n=1 Tax=Heterocephalus glaber TaxID=10181 RepID=A0AAX6TCR6_HETGA|nr:uncharacterized protein LOC110350320 [Heterocephalus glaber]